MNLSAAERAGMESDSLSSERYCEASCEIDGLRARARCGLEDEPPNACLTDARDTSQERSLDNNSLSIPALSPLELSSETIWETVWEPSKVPKKSRL